MHVRQLVRSMAVVYTCHPPPGCKRGAKYAGVCMGGAAMSVGGYWLRGGPSQGPGALHGARRVPHTCTTPPFSTCTRRQSVVWQCWRSFRPNSCSTLMRWEFIPTITSH